MALVLKMQINEQPENQYVFSTGDNGEIELIPLSVMANGSYTAPDGKAYNLVTVNVPDTELNTLNITENGTYNAPDGTAYNVVTVNVEPILEAVSRTYTANGTYTIAPSSGKDGISGVTVVVDVPQDTPDLQSKSELYTSNGTYSVSPDSGYDGLSGVDIEVNVPATPTPSIQASKSQTITQNGTVTVSPDSGYDAMEEAVLTVDVPTGGGGGDVLTGTFTVADGVNTVPITVPSGKTIKTAFIALHDFDDSASITIRRVFFTNLIDVTTEGVYNYGLYRNSASGTAVSGTGTHNTGTISIPTVGCAGLDSTKTQLQYRGKNVDENYGLPVGFVYDYLVVLE